MAREKGTGGWRAGLLGDVPALPIDIFRIAAGLLGAAYFVRLLLEARDFSSPDGFLDHALLLRMYWFARISLFQPGLTLPAIYALFGLGVAGSLALAAGWRPRACAVVLLALAASASRWNLIVTEIDDTLMGLLFLWLVLLPVGSTLTWEGLSRPAEAWRRWRGTRVPGAAVRFFTVNVCLVYAVAAGWKLTSPMWRSGFALYATLRLPIAYWPDLWGPGDLPLLRIATWLALAAELALPALLLAPKGSVFKRLGLACQLGFHAGIALLLRIPFANLALMATSLLFFREELMDALFGRRPEPGGRPRRAGRAEALSGVLLLLVTLSVLRRIPVLGALSLPATRALWLVGIHQDYRLFNWIDRKNYRGDYRFLWRPEGGAERAEPASVLFPSSMRSVLTQSYLVGDLWLFIPSGYREPLRASILYRAARRFCARAGGDGRGELSARVERISPENADLREGEERPLMEFACSGGRVELLRGPVGP